MDVRVEQIVKQLTDTCNAFNINSSDDITKLTKTLDAFAVELGKNPDLRVKLGASSVQRFWASIIKKLWKLSVAAQVNNSDGSPEGENTDRQPVLRLMSAALARFTRNLVAGVPENQAKAFDIEPDLRQLLHFYTSWMFAQDEQIALLTRILTQTLSNIITGNDPLLASLWQTYMRLPEEQVVLIRLLGTRDPSSLLAVLVLIRNSIHRSRSRTRLLVTSQAGRRICVSMLDNMVTLYDAEESSDGGRAFNVGYDIFSRIIQTGLVPDLYSVLTIPDEIITPHQTTILKLVDSHLLQGSANANRKKTPKNRAHITPLMGRCFFSLSLYAQDSIRRALGKDHDAPLQELDVMLPKVCEALVLVVQCIITLALEAEVGRDQQPAELASANPSDAEASDGEAAAAALTSPTLAEKDPRLYLNGRSSEGGVGIIENLVELLRLLDRFLPRINFGKPVSGNNGVAEEDDLQRTPMQSTFPSQSPLSSAVQNDGFAYLKRDLVRLLGILCHGTKTVQDRIRGCGGIEVVMNLCVVDERNPYLREHAIFTLHSLLEGNKENQAIVESIKPMGQWDTETGELKDATGGVRK